MAKFQHKQRILKAAREKQEVTYKGAPVRLVSDISMEMLQARREWQKIFQVMRTIGLQPRLLYPGKALNQDRRPEKEFPRQKKSKRIYLHQNSSTRDAKDAAVRKGRKREKEGRTQVQRIGNEKYQSEITLNVNGFNAPTKRHRIAEWIRKHDTHIFCLQENYTD